MPNELDFRYSEENQNALFQGVYIGAVNALNLPKRLYSETANSLKKALYKGYGGTLAEFEFGTPDYKLINELRNNVYMFSGAKTFTEVEHLKSLMYVDNEKLSYSVFKKRAKETFKLYNEAYLDTEYTTAVTSGQSASKYLDAWTNKKLFPKLKYVAILDSATAQVCRDMDGLVAYTTEKIWFTHTPPNHFNCRCHIEMIDEYENEPVTGIGKVTEIMEKSKSNKYISSLFKMNPARDGYVFKSEGKGSHPYFTVEPKYEELKKHNFNLPIPKKDGNN